MRALFLLAAAVTALSFPGAAAQAPADGSAPETFSATAQVKTATGPVSGPIQIHVRRYTPDFDRTTVETALKSGGYPAFLIALRKAPEVGTVAAGNQKVAIRWAREQKTAKGRTVVVVTEKPLFFVGRDSGDPKARAGYEVAVIELLVDDRGQGSGTMAAAARVKPDGEGGVRLDDFAEALITLEKVGRTKS